MKQYFAFVEYFEPNTYSINVLLSVFRIQKFISFYDGLDKKPNSIGNKAKYML